ncbi:MAG: hypothetical protein K0R57_6091 [Paenibacillaceae bacterium]|jgi:hypothetical protein|nr:hypothetical protein [Paenibacillaceae bacterium]
MIDLKPYGYIEAETPLIGLIPGRVRNFSESNIPLSPNAPDGVRVPYPWTARSFYKKNNEVNVWRL